MDIYGYRCEDELGTKKLGETINVLEVSPIMGVSVSATPRHNKGIDDG